MAVFLKSLNFYRATTLIVTIICKVVILLTVDF